MSLCALIYNNIKGINTCNDLVQIMEVQIMEVRSGYEIMSSLARSAANHFRVLRGWIYPRFSAMTLHGPL